MKRTIKLEMRVVDSKIRWCTWIIWWLYNLYIKSLTFNEIKMIDD